MADFLSNLLIRSAADPLTSVMLQPRLPSLFEPQQSPDEVQTHITDVISQNDFAPASVPFAGVIPPSHWENKPSTIHVKNDFSAKREAQSGTIPHQVEKPVKLFDEPEERIIPDHGHDDSPVNLFSAIQEQPFHLPEGGSKAERAGSAPAHVQAHEKVVLPKERIKSSIEINIRPTEEDYAAEDESSAAVYFPLKTNLNSATQLQPILPVSHPAGQDKKREPQNVVEIHIGRVEVRAIAAPAAQPSKPRPAAIMTLDEYLQRRKAGER